MVRILLAILTLVMLACSNNSNQKINANVVDDYNVPNAPSNTPTPTHTQISTKHALIMFKQSDCKPNTQASEKFLHKELRSDTLLVKVRSTQNCDTQYKGDFNFSDNHLNLTLTQLPKIIKRKNGETDTVYTSHECNCVYEFTYSINNTYTTPQTITLNDKVIN